MNRHVEALSEELLGRGHHVRVLAPVDPPGRLSRIAHRAAPEPRELPDYLIPLGRTVGISANGAVSNISVSPRGGVVLPRRELRGEDFDVVHIHEPVVPLVGWNAALGTGRPGGGDLPHVLDQGVPQPHRLGARRPAGLQPPLGADRRLRGGGLDRAALVRRPLRDHPQRRRHRRRPQRSQAPVGGAAGALRRPPGGAQGPADPAHGVRRPDRARPLPADRDRSRARGRAALPRRPGDDALDRRPRPRLRRAALGPPARGRPALRPIALGRELRHGPDRGLRRRDARHRLGDRRLQRRRHRRGRRRARSARRRPAAGRGAAARLPRARAPAGDGRGGTAQCPALRLAARRRSGHRGLRAGDRGAGARDTGRTSSRTGPGCGPPTGCRRPPRSGCPRSTRRWPGAAAPGAGSPAASASASPERSASD